MAANQVVEIGGRGRGGIHHEGRGKEGWVVPLNKTMKKRMGRGRGGWFSIQVLSPHSSFFTFGGCRLPSMFPPPPLAVFVLLLLLHCCQSAYEYCCQPRSSSMVVVVPSVAHAFLVAVGRWSAFPLCRFSSNPFPFMPHLDLFPRTLKGPIGLGPADSVGQFCPFVHWTAQMDMHTARCWECCQQFALLFGGQLWGNLWRKTVHKWFIKWRAGIGEGNLQKRPRGILIFSIKFFR